MIADVERIAIVVDSTNSLPKSVIGDLPLAVVPLTIQFGLDSYLDGIDISPEEFYRLLSKSPVRPMTSAPSPQDFLNTFRSLAMDYSHIACLTLSGKLSATYNAAVSASESFKLEFPDIMIEVIDSHTAGGGLGLVALQCSRNVAKGQSWDALMDNLARMIPKIRFMGILDDLKYLADGGRIPKFAAIASSALSIKIILGIERGEIVSLGKARTVKNAIRRIVDMATNDDSQVGGYAAIMYSDSKKPALELEAAVKERLGPRETLVIPFTPVIGAHTGPGLIGVALLHPFRN